MIKTLLAICCSASTLAATDRYFAQVPSGSVGYHTATGHMASAPAQLRVSVYLDTFESVQIDQLSIGGSVVAEPAAPGLSVDVRMEMADAELGLSPVIAEDAWEILRVPLPAVVTGSLMSDVTAISVSGSLGPAQLLPRILFSTADDGISVKALAFDHVFDTNPLEVRPDLVIDQVTVNSPGVDWLPLTRTPPGDATNDGQVTFGDFLVLAQNFLRAEARWEQGDFDRDGVVAFADFLQLTRGFQSPAAVHVQSVPEPSAGLFCWVSAMLLGLRPWVAKSPWVTNGCV